MSLSSNKRAYKVTSLLIKTLILALSFYYIIHKLKFIDERSIIPDYLNEKENIQLIIFTFLLMFLNWGIEALKWMLLISPLEKISFGKSLKSIFAGVTVSIFMPNRIGEFAGRVFFLDQADKIEATLKNFIGAFTQFCITLIAGIAAWFLLYCKGYEGAGNTSGLDSLYVRFMLILILLFFLILFILYRIRLRLPEKIQVYLRLLFETEKKAMLTVLALSALRYLVFLFQYYMVLRAFGIKPDLIPALSLIAMTFFITSIVPSFAFTEIATRGAAAMYLFEASSSDGTAVLTASFIVWIINLAIPALIGGLFIWKLKFFKA
jgi:hypothetical protein